MLAVGWGLAAALGAVAGVLAAQTLFLDPNMMQPVLLYALAAAVLGGMDSPLGAVLGGLILGVLLNLVGTLRALGRRRAAACRRGRRDRLRPARATVRPLRPRGGEPRHDDQPERECDSERRSRLHVLLALPFPVSEVRTVQLATVGTSFIAILGLDILTGASGQLSLGHGAFMAVGAYTTAILVAHHGVRDLWTIAAAAGVAGGRIGLLAGLPGAASERASTSRLRRSGSRSPCRRSWSKFDHFTGGSTGISFFGSPHETGRGYDVEVLGVQLSNGQWLYALTWAIGVALFLLAWWLLGSRFGRSLRAVRDSEPAAATAGVNRAAYRLAAFVISAAYAGVARLAARDRHGLRRARARSRSSSRSTCSSAPSPGASARSGARCSARC